MAIALDGSVISTDVADTQSITIGSNNNRLLLVAFGTHQGGGPSGVTYNGVSMTKIVEQVGSFSEQVSIWGLIAPATGTHDVVVSGVSSYRGISIYSLYNVDQAALPSITNGATGSSASASLSITPTLDNCWIVDSVTAEDALTMSTVGGVSDAIQVGASFENLGASHFVQVTAGAKTMSYTVASGQRWNICAVVVAPYVPPTAALTGTVTATIKESDIVAGGKTIILTLTNDTWVTAGGTFDAQRQNIINGLTSAQSETNGWNNEVKGKIAVSDVVRTSGTVVTITLDAEAGYNITASEIITVTIPSTAVTGGAAIVASPTFRVSEYPISFLKLETGTFLKIETGNRIGKES